MASNTHKALYTKSLYHVKRKKTKKGSKKNSRMNIFAKRLNEDLPKSEIWFDGKFKSHQFYSQFKKNVVVGKYIVDLLDSRNRIVIEVDGSIHDNEVQKFKDFLKDKYLTDKRYTVIRVVAYDEESYNNCIVKLESVLGEIKNIE